MDHRPEQAAPSPHKRRRMSPICAICMTELESLIPNTDVLLVPCCQRELLHRECLQVHCTCSRSSSSSSSGSASCSFSSSCNICSIRSCCSSLVAVSVVVVNGSILPKQLTTLRLYCSP